MEQSENLLKFNFTQHNFVSSGIAEKLGAMMYDFDDEHDEAVNQQDEYQSDQQNEYQVDQQEGSY
jgi:hypothetical protein